MAKNVLKHNDLIVLADKLRLVCIKKGSYAEYLDGWSDQRIISESEGKYTVHNVVGMREQLIGKLEPAKSTDQMKLLVKRIEDLEKLLGDRIAALEYWAAQRPVASFNKRGEF